MNTQYHSPTQLDNVHTDDIFLKKRIELWTKNNWRISEKSIKNLEESIQKGKIKKHPKF